METEDRKAKELFQQLKHDDKFTAPSFAGMLETVAASGERKTGSWLNLRLAMVPIAAAMVLLMGMILAAPQQLPSRRKPAKKSKHGILLV